MERQIEATSRPAAGGMSAFFAIWFGQTISLLGTGLTGFALGVWVFQQTHSATALALIAFFGMLPIIIFSPLAGALVDRWDRRWALILSESGAALTPLVLIVLLQEDQILIWPICLVVAISGTFRAFQFPAFTAATTMLVPKEQYGRASGLTQLGGGIGQLISPVLAGVLIGSIGLWGVYIIDVVTYAISIVILIAVRIPSPPRSAEGRAASGSLLKETLYGWTYIVARPGLLALLLFFAAINFLMSTVIVLANPLMLSFTTPDALGIVLSVSGSGILVGSVLMSIWGGPKPRVYGVLGSLLLSSVSIMVAGLAPSALLIGAAAFFFTMGMPISAGSSQAIWQSKVLPEVQGRVFATRSMIAMASMPIAYLLSGPLADYVFNPLLVQGGPLAGSVGQIIGVGPGRGIGLLFIVLGFFGVLSVIGGYLYPRLRLVEQELPDAVPDAPPASALAIEPDLAGA